MLQVTRSHERYHFENDWLSAYWHFSFDHYNDPKNMGYGSLRVFNNDTIQPGKGFPTHPHRDMEILTYVIRGALEHKDSTGGHGLIQAGELQRMSAGTGIMHSEFNASKTDTCELVQIWVLPREKGVPPSYEQKQFSEQDRSGKLLPVASGNGAPGALKVKQDANFYISRLRPDDELSHTIEDGRRGYLFVVEGSPQVSGEQLAKGDSVKISDESELTFRAEKSSEILLIDLP